MVNGTAAGIDIHEHTAMTAAQSAIIAASLVFRPAWPALFLTSEELTNLIYTCTFLRLFIMPLRLPLPLSLSHNH
jgi:hypothetical protein